VLDAVTKPGVLMHSLIPKILRGMRLTDKKLAITQMCMHTDYNDVSW